MPRTAAFMKGSAGSPLPPAVARDLQRVRAALQDVRRGFPAALQPLVEGGALSGGKLLRPALVLLSGRACDAVTEDHIRVATVLELIHSASLLHDDVLDGGRLRRGTTTVNVRWGNRAAVKLGDLLLSRALERSTLLPPPARRILSRMILRTCVGELRQTAQAGNFLLSEGQYLTLIEEKTAALFEGACELGAGLSLASPWQCRALARFGHCAGLAYQIVDDLLDLIGDSAVLHKTLGTDLQRAKLTLPLIHCLQVLIGSPKAALLEKLRTRSLTGPHLRRALAASGSMEYVLTYIHTCTAQAADALQGFRPTLAKASLLALPRLIAQEAVERSAGALTTPAAQVALP
jgi:octaprenyl-diphosphate synthase